MRRSAVVLWLTALALVLAVPAAAQVEEARDRLEETQARLDEVREEQAALQTRLDQAAEELADSEARIAALEERQAAFREQAEQARAVAEQADDRMALRAREMYKRGAPQPFLALLGGDTVQEAIDRAEVMERLVAADRVESQDAVAAETAAQAAERRLDEAQAELEKERRAYRARLDELKVDLDRAGDLQQELQAREAADREAVDRAEAEAARAAAAAAAAEAAQSAASSSSASDAPAAAAPSAPAPASGGRACPIGRPHSFTNTWGAPRSGGRSHKGTDLLANYGVPNYAIVSGTWDVMRTGGSAGVWGILHGDDGNDYWYLHLTRHSVGDGARVSAGQQVGTTGDTGNARGTPHTHFEYHPGRGGPVNPYSMLRSLCG